MIRKIAGVIAGYSIFVATSIAYFQLSKHNPHTVPTTAFMILTAVYGAVCSFISGLVAQLIARAQNLSLNYVLAFFLAGFATFSFFKAEGSHWTQLLAIFIFAPISIFGGLFYLKQYKE